MYVCFSLVRFSLFGSPLKRKSDYNQTWVKDETGVPSYVNKVKSHIAFVKGSVLVWVIDKYSEREHFAGGTRGSMKHYITLHYPYITLHFFLFLLL